MKHWSLGWIGSDHALGAFSIGPAWEIMSIKKDQRTRLTNVKVVSLSVNVEEISSELQKSKRTYEYVPQPYDWNVTQTEL